MSTDPTACKAALEARLEDVIRAYWPGVVFRGREARPVPGERGDLRSFVVYLADVGAYRRGDWFRSSEGIGGDVLNLIAYAISGDHRTAHQFRRVMEEAERHVGGVAAVEPARVEGHAPRWESVDARNMRHARELWHAAVPIKGTVAERYLIARGIPVQDWPPSLRFVERLRHPDGREWPALICRRYAAGVPFGGVWRIYLAPDGSSKAPVAPARMGLGRCEGSFVPLCQAHAVGARIGVCEGVETGFGAMALNPGRPVLACLSTGGLISARLPERVRDVVIYADADPPSEGSLGIRESPGLAAAQRLCSRLRQAGVAVTILSPPEGKDFLDAWRAEFLRHGDSGENRAHGVEGVDSLGPARQGAS